MTPDDLPPTRFPLRGSAQDVVLEQDGVRHPWTARGRGRAFTAYGAITHLAVTERFVWIASRRALTVLSRGLFQEPGDAERLLRVLLERVGQSPGGDERLERIADVDAWGRDPAPPLVTRGVAMLCLVLFGLQYLFAPVTAVGSFVPALFADGDWWRLLTANLLHSGPVHFALNLIGLLVVGRLVERSLGPVRTLCVMGASAVASMGASGLWIDGQVIGVSGVLFGLVGALMFLEMARAEQLPAWWRFPRVLLWFMWIALGFELLLGFWVPFIAGEAHLGGMVGGALAAAWLTRGAGLQAPVGVWARNAAALTLAATVVAVAAAGEHWLGADDFTAEYAARLVRIPGIEPETLNNQAWVIAIDPGHTRKQLKAALALAERAVEATEAGESTILDTLAEVQFQLGRAEDAVLTIDLALELAPDESHYRYYYEQRRRFTGERPPADRPADPNFLPPWGGDPDEPRRMSPPEDGLAV